MEIVKKLMLHVDKAEGTTYRDELLTKIIDICSQSNYQYITNFEWSDQFTPASFSYLTLLKNKYYFPLNDPSALPPF